MWTCSRCGRTFKKQNQAHYCGNPPETIAEYIALQPEETQPFLQQVYHVLRTALPEAQERISWGMPTFWDQRNLIHFAANKRHIGLYAGDAAVAAFASRLAPYKANKGTIQSPYQEPLPLELISQIAAFAAFHGS